MRITKEQLKQIIKEELETVLEDIDRPEFPGEELPQGQDLGQALTDVDTLEHTIAIKEKELKKAHRALLSLRRNTSMPASYDETVAATKEVEKLEKELRRIDPDTKLPQELKDNPWELKYARGK